jgi:hypothetical protein
VKKQFRLSRDENGVILGLEYHKQKEQLLSTLDDENNCTIISQLSNLQ